MKKIPYLFIIFCFLVCFLVVPGCISYNGASKPVFEEKQMNFTPAVISVRSQNDTTIGNCSSTPASGFQEPYVEFLSGETTKTVSYTFFSKCAGPAELSYTLVPVINWNKRDPVHPADWVNVSIEPSLLAISSSQTYTSEVIIRLTQNSTNTSASGPAKNRVAFFYLKPSINNTVQVDAEDWLCVQENYNYRTLLRPRLRVVIENNNLVVHPGSSNQTSIILNTQSQGLDFIQYEILSKNNNSAFVLQNNLLKMEIAPSGFSTRSFRNYTSVLSVNASDELSPGVYQFTIVIHSKTLTELQVRVENI